MNLTSYELGYLVAAAGLGELSEEAGQEAKEVKMVGLKFLLELEDQSEEDKQEVFEEFLKMADKVSDRINKIKAKISKEEEVVSE